LLGDVTLAVDSLGPRVIGIANRCGKGLPDQAFDAYPALHHLSQLDFVDTSAANSTCMQRLKYRAATKSEFESASGASLVPRVPFQPERARQATLSSWRRFR
jgi:hypothetical protein